MLLPEDFVEVAVSCQFIVDRLFENGVPLAELVVLVALLNDVILLSSKEPIYLFLDGGMVFLLKILLDHLGDKVQHRLKEKLVVVYEPGAVLQEDGAVVVTLIYRRLTISLSMLCSLLLSVSKSCCFLFPARLTILVSNVLYLLLIL